MKPLTPAGARRIRLQLALIPIYIWTLVSWSNYVVDVGVQGRLDRSGHIKGHDFAHFYVLGQIGLERAVGDLYSFDAHAARSDRLVPEYEDRFLPVHAPQVSMFFAPLAALPYPAAVACWLALTALLYALCCRILWRQLPELHEFGLPAAMLAVGCPAFFFVMATGQTSAFALAWFTLALVALKNDRPWLAGLALGSLAYKPTLGLLLPFVFLYSREYRVLAGATIAASAQFVAAWSYLGRSAISGYVENFRTVAESNPLLEAQPQAMHSLRSFFTLLAPSLGLAEAAYLLSAAFVAVVATRTWKPGVSLNIRFAALLLATVLVSPHLYAYDLLILLPAFFLIAAWRLGSTGQKGWGLWALLYLAYFLPAFDGLATMTHIQWSVPVMVALLIVVSRAGKAEGDGRFQAGDRIVISPIPS